MENGIIMETCFQGKFSKNVTACFGRTYKANGRIRTDNHWFTKPELYR